MGSRKQIVASLALAPLTAETMSAFAALLGGDDFGGCFCAVWTSFGDDWVERCRDPARPNLAITEHDVRAGRRAGFLVLHDEDVVAWTGAGPASEFPALATRHGARRHPPRQDGWVLGCLAIRADYRGSGLSESVVRAVVNRAEMAGARAIDAYPVRPWDEPRSYRGAETTYTRCGFVEVGFDDPVIVMRRLLGGAQ